jgi:hypothetical protein
MPEGSHSFEVELTATCAQCHPSALTIDDITPAFRPEDNWDGDPATKPKAEVAVFAARLYAAIQTYCAAAGNPTAYNGASYPYWFKDPNMNGAVDPNEKTAMRFDSKSLRAAFNYQFYQKEPGAWAHNNPYIVQILYDSIEDLGGSLVGLTRP